MLGPGSSATEIIDALSALGDRERAAGSRRFFKTGPGQYGAGDHFLGISVPQLRTTAKPLRGLSASTITELLDSRYHEARQLALFALTANVTAPGSDRAAWVQLYRRAVRAGRVNNWDLVDCSAGPILGTWLVAADDHSELLEWAASDDLWERRVGIIATFAFIRAGRAEAILAVAPLVVADRRDLIQKAFGWMLRETGKRVDRTVLTDYLDEHAADMGRTALSYAVEHLSAEDRARYRALR